MAAPLDTEVAIETPEHIVFHYRVAGPSRRLLAYLLDLFLCYTTLAVLAILLLFAVAADFGKGAEQLGSTAGAAVGFFLVLLFAAQWLYFLVLEGWKGRTPGKAALGLRVVTVSGRPIGFRASALRNLLRAADFLPTGYVAGVVSMALTSRFQRIGDLVAGTMVVAPAHARKARALELTPPATPKELATLPDEVVLDAEERAAIELFLRRRVTLGLARERELAAMMAKPLAERMQYHHPDPSRLLAILYDRAANAGRSEAPPSSLHPSIPPVPAR